MAGVMTGAPHPEHPDAPSGEAPPASKSQRKREMTELQKLGERLVTLSREQIDRMALPPELREAVIFAGTLTRHGARRRQMQRIGALMRDVDPGPIRASLDQLDQRHYHEIMRFKEAESWRERLLTDGDAVVEEMTATFPSADRQRIRQLLRNAGKEGHPSKKARASKQLFRYVIDLLAEASEPER
jgi:ribosome-associated protein